MSPTRIDLDLDEALQRFIELEVAAGRFSSANAVIEAALQLLEERESRLAALRSIMAEAERSQRHGQAAPPGRASDSSVRASASTSQ